MTEFSWDNWTKQARPIELAGTRALNELLAADHAHQELVCKAGGEITGQLTDEGEAAAREIQARTRKALDAIHVPQSKLMDLEHRRRAAALLEAAEAFDTTYRELLGFEEVQGPFLQHAGLPQRLRVIANGDLSRQLQDAAARARRLVQPPPAPRVAAPRPIVGRPDFSSLLRRVLGRA